MDYKTNRLAKIFNLFTFLSLGAVVIVLLATLGSGFFNFIGNTFAYAYEFIAFRAWDTKKIIGVVVAVIAIVAWIVWVVTSQIKTKSNTSIAGPLLVLFLPFVALVVYHNRHNIEEYLSAESTKIPFIILFVLLVLLFVSGILSIVFGVRKDIKEAKNIVLEDSLDVDDEECDCCKEPNEDSEKMQEQVDELRKDVDELKKILILDQEELEDVEEDEPEEDDSQEVPVAVKQVIARRPFAEKMAKASQETKDNYDILKNELLSYGVKSRLSSGGDTFRLKRQTYALITLVGKNLKIYLALDPNSYDGTTIPAKDESGKKRYVEVPTMLRIKSKLSVKRAKLLIADLMKSRNLEQGEVQEVKYSSQMKTRKPRKAIAK